MMLNLDGIVTIEQTARDVAMVTDERLKLAALEFANWKEPMDKANEDLRIRLAAIKGKWEEENSELIRENKDVKSNLIPGWGVAVSEEIEVAEPVAIQWLIEHNHREALKLDAVKFKKLAEVLKPDFVTFREKVTAKINPTKGAK